MNLVQITPGAGGMYCGNCLRDNALVADLRRRGHPVLMVPLYLPLRLDEEDQSAGTPVFFGGVTVYLEQRFAPFRRAPDWLRRPLSSPRLLRWAAGRAAKTRPDQVGDLTVSMLRGEEGNQNRELDELIGWLKTQPHPDVICLSNALLVGLARRLRRELRAAVVCTLQGEDAFLDSLPEPHRQASWETLSQRASDVDLFIAPSRYFGDRMRQRLRLPAVKVEIVPNGIALDGYQPAEAPPDPPVLGYFARMCPEKGLETLVEAYLRLCERGRFPQLRLRVGGGCGPADEPFVNRLRSRLQAQGCGNRVEFCPNLDRPAKQAFLRSLTVFSVPATSGEAFGLYLLEALASGVPVVQPRVAAFPELIEATGGGVLCEPGNAAALAESVETLLRNPERARALGEAGHRAVRRDFSVARLAERTLRLYQALTVPQPSALDPQPV